jgi:hypothetical protein
MMMATAAVIPVSRFGSSHVLAATFDANFGIKGGASSFTAGISFINSETCSGL